jgi:hypothetical protein
MLQQPVVNYYKFVRNKQTNKQTNGRVLDMGMSYLEVCCGATNGTRNAAAPKAEYPERAGDAAADRSPRVEN